MFARDNVEPDENRALCNAGEVELCWTRKRPEIHQLYIVPASRRAKRLSRAIVVLIVREPNKVADRRG